MAAAVECVVIGAGVVGLACARRAARKGMEVVILDSESLIGSVTSARNSEVIHAGIYYPKGSKKADMCVRGRKMLYKYCDSHGVPYKRCGKLIVATSIDELSVLKEIEKKAIDNGVLDLQQLTKEEAIAMEPELYCEGALWSPSTGIIDSHSLMLSLLGDAEVAGASLALNSPVIGGNITSTGEILIQTGGEAPMELLCKHVINCAGLSAPMVARAISDVNPDPNNAKIELESLNLPRAYFAKGNYYVLQGKAPFSRLVYPIPNEAGLGVHATIDMAGQMCVSKKKKKKKKKKFLNFFFFFKKI
eukprot:GSMAST32.ASY1.ANO1.2301.1 assembled CDS